MMGSWLFIDLITYFCLHWGLFLLLLKIAKSNQADLFCHCLLEEGSLPEKPKLSGEAFYGKSPDQWFCLLCFSMCGSVCS